MADAYTRIYIQVVFAVKNRKALIQPAWENELYKYITGIIQNKGQKLLAINGNYDHIHFFIGMRANCCLSDLVREVKKSSTLFIKDKKFSPCHFQWQKGYGAFSYNHSQLGNIIRYIDNQKEHHKKQVFRDEFLIFLKKFDISFRDEYLFDFLKRAKNVKLFNKI